jgi:hypothetical protein
MAETPKKPLTPQEVQTFKMLATWEELVDNKRIFGTLEMSDLAVDTMKKYDIAKPLKIIPSLSSPNRRAVRFDLIELARYLSYSCKCVGFRVGLNGDVTTSDGTVLSIPFSTVPTKLSYDGKPNK